MISESYRRIWRQAWPKRSREKKSVENRAGQKAWWWGAQNFGRMQPLIAGRQETEIVEAADGVWALQESELAYGKETAPKIAPCDRS